MFGKYLDQIKNEIIVVGRVKKDPQPKETLPRVYAEDGDGEPLLLRRAEQSEFIELFRAAVVYSMDRQRSRVVCDRTSGALYVIQHPHDIRDDIIQIFPDGSCDCVADIPADKLVLYGRLIHKLEQ